MPMEALRQAVSQLAHEAAAIIRDKHKSLFHRALAFMVVIFAASPFALATLIAIAALYFQMREQSRICVEEGIEDRKMRMAIEEKAATDRAALEERMALRGDKNTLIITSAIGELGKSFDRVARMVEDKDVSKNGKKSDPVIERMK